MSHGPREKDRSCSHGETSKTHLFGGKDKEEAGSTAAKVGERQSEKSREERVVDD